MKRIALAAVLIGIGIAAVAAQADAIKARQALMKANDANGRLLGQMARGRVPFDAAKADAAFAQFAETAAKLPGLFPDNSKSGDTKASPKIWQKPISTQGRGIRQGRCRKSTQGKNPRRCESGTAGRGKSLRQLPRPISAELEF